MGRTGGAQGAGVVAPSWDHRSKARGKLPHCVGRQGDSSAGTTGPARGTGKVRSEHLPEWRLLVEKVTGDSFETGLTGLNG